MPIDSKKIAKNTAFLYIRMLLLMAITFYTVRIVLKELGEEDYGIYNIVGGIVILLSFIQSAMTSAFHRFISYEIGCGTDISINKSFKSCLTISIVFTLIIFVLLETVGLWGVNYILKIPPNKMYAANIVYQFSIIAFIVNFLRIPYQALIVSYERMSFFSYVSIIEGCLRLLTSGSLIFIPANKLILYGAIIALISIITIIIYICYCKNNLNTAVYNWYWEKIQCKKMLVFSGYSMGISISNVVSQQGGNLLLNYFSGLIANASLGIANQVGAAIMSFASSFQTAFSPQITKLYSNKEYEALFSLVIKASAYSYMLMLIIAVPIITYMRWGLGIWLGEVPEFSVGFCIWITIYQMIDALQAPLNTMIYATGNLKTYTTWLSIFLLLNIPISALMLYFGFSPISVLIIRTSINFITAIVRTLWVKRILNFPIDLYLKSAIFKIFLLTIIICGGCIIIKSLNIGINEFWLLIASILFSVVCAYYIGIEASERKKILVYIKKRLNR